ncbi:natural cytotoxicity triggering receptor 3 ligand 1-like isoform X2 [Bufo gargarizans]|uniref:natural cytotoxicity triggering receptor 3 ligand 1-like isoform X2 n=1 Tax=Bufo gargarizans TaxID=30331 RepID=UPI001CF2F713|nr:natural cytotoxicity triggering receptor 3 ligand 1-like isoform X2 [Bufo gargarizans]
MGFIQYVTQMFLLVIIFSLLGHSSGKLEILKNDSPIKALVGEDITVPCNLTGYKNSSLTTSTVSVRWTKGTVNKLVVFYDGEKYTHNRSGSYISERNLVRGDASLYIPNLQFSDEGEYTCYVIVTPEDATSKVTVQVSAMPSCRLSDSTLVMDPDTERSVTCYVNGFYPESVEIQWLKYSKASSKQSELNSQTYTSEPVQNHDGTYNVTSVLFTRPVSRDEDGDVYSCVVSHRSLTDGLTSNVTLSVKSIISQHILCIFGVCILLVLVLAVILYYCIKVKPKVTEISKTYLIHKKKKYSLRCFISGFRPNNLTIKLYTEKDKGNQIKVDSWSSIKPRKRSPENNTEQGTPLQTKDEPRKRSPENDTEQGTRLHEPTHLALAPLIKRCKLFLFNCDCFIDITPMFHIHDGAVLTLEVRHAALTTPIYRHLQLKVKGKPKMDKIGANQEFYKSGDLLQLNSKIHSFYPESINVIWYKDREEIKSQVTAAKNDVKGLFSVVSSMQCTVTEEDFGKTFKCKVMHETTSDSVTWRLEKRGN